MASFALLPRGGVASLPLVMPAQKPSWWRLFLWGSEPRGEVWYFLKKYLLELQATPQFYCHPPKGSKVLRDFFPWQHVCYTSKTRFRDVFKSTVCHQYVNTTMTWCASARSSKTERFTSLIGISGFFGPWHLLMGIICSFISSFLMRRKVCP